MTKIVHNKLVRDRIPDIIRRNGKRAETSLLLPEQFEAALDAKLEEEVHEYLKSHDPEELADVLEVVHAIAARKGVEWKELETMRRKKKDERGGFSKGIFLHFVEEG